MSESLGETYGRPGGGFSIQSFVSPVQVLRVFFLDNKVICI